MEFGYFTLREICGRQEAVPRRIKCSYFIHIGDGQASPLRLRDRTAPSLCGRRRA